MSQFGSLSEASILAIYSMILIGGSRETLNAGELARRLGASRNHLSKILMLLQQHGYLGSQRGPSGGFYLRKPPEEVNLLDIYELVAGKMVISGCSSERENCPFNICVLENKINELKLSFVEFLQSKTLSDLRNSAVFDVNH